jgi:dihydrofolate synthase / folylpolyglutamate synthase
MSSPVLSDYAAVQDYLFGLKAKGMKFGIDRMRGLSAALRHPERAQPIIHLAGTNGKGSTAAMLDAILRAAGKRVGLYTSPHLVRLGERVQVDRQILSEAEIIAFVAELRPVAEELGQLGPDDHPSFFEFMTAMAFLQFARRHCDVGVVEVGLGGRLDATNVVQPEVSVITSIGFDHCEMLGYTLTSIATEKAGIIKPGRPVVMGRLPPEAEAVVRAIARAQGSELHSVREEFGEDLDGYPHTSLEGDYQRWNAATATLVARCLPASWGINAGHVEHGLDHSNWPGRWQRLEVGERRLILDASHNPEGAQVLDVSLRRLEAETGRRPIIVAGVLGPQRAESLLASVGRHAAAVHLVVPQQARACSHEELVKLLPPEFTGPVHRSTVAGLFPRPDICTAGGPDDVIVVTGSIYLVGEVLARLQPERGPGEGRLQDF